MSLVGVFDAALEERHDRKKPLAVLLDRTFDAVGYRADASCRGVVRGREYHQHL
jgi:hypothetical protein